VFVRAGELVGTAPVVAVVGGHHRLAEDEIRCRLCERGTVQSARHIRPVHEIGAEKIGMVVVRRHEAVEPELEVGTHRAQFRRDARVELRHPVAPPLEPLLPQDRIGPQRRGVGLAAKRIPPIHLIQTFQLLNVPTS